MYKSILLFIAVCITIFPLSGCDVTAANTGAVSAIQSSNTADTSTNSVTNTNYASAQIIHLTNGKNTAITKGGSYSISGTLADGQITVDTTEEVFIELAGASITNSKGAAIQVDNAKKITITLKKGTANTVEDGGSSDYNAAIFTNDTLVIEGAGNLEIIGNQGHGIESDDDIIINGGITSITAITDGIHAKDNLTINGGTIDIPTAYEGMESKGDLIINGGKITVFCTDDGLNAATDITANDGKIYIKATKGDAIDCNGPINIKGGTVIAIGAGQPEGGIDCDRNNLNITSGTLVAVGGTNSTPTAASSAQHSVLLAGVAANTLLHIEDADSGDVLTFKADTAYQSMVFSSPLLKANATYTIYSGGNASGGSNENGLYSGAAYANGTKGDSFTTNEMVTVHGGNTGMGGGRLQGGGRMPQGEMPSGKMPQGDMPQSEPSQGSQSLIKTA